MDPLDDVRKKHEELLKVSREALRVDRQRKDAFEGMVKTPGWKEFQNLLNTMINDRGMSVLSPAGSMEGAVALEFVKGTMNGLILARDLPSLIIDATPATKIEDDNED